MKRTHIVNKIAEILREVASDSQRILYGSEARGEARDDSDIDILVILPEGCEGLEFVERQSEIIGRLYDVELEYLVDISTLVVPKKHWERFRTPFTINVMNDGITL